MFIKIIKPNKLLLLNAIKQLEGLFKSKIFTGKSKIDQHKLVYKALKGKMGNELHALALTTEGK